MTLFYVGTVVLGMEERAFWRCTLRKLRALFACHCRIQGGGHSGQRHE